MSKLCSSKSPKFSTTSPSSRGLVIEEVCKGDFLQNGQRELGGPMPSVFRKTFQRAQEKRENKTHPRPVSSKQKVGGSKIQNGPHFKNSSLHQGRSLGNHNGSRRCVFSFKDKKEIPEVLRLCPVGRRSGKTKGIYLSGSSLRSVHSPLEFQPGYQTSKTLSKVPRYPGPLILGRFPKSRPSPSDYGEHKQDRVSLREAGFPSQLGEVVPCSFSKSSLSRSYSESRRSQPLPSHGKSSTAFGLRTQGPRDRFPFKKGSGASGGFSKLHSRFSPFRKTLLKANNSLVEPEYVGFHKRSANPGGSGLEGGPSSLVGHRSSYKPSPNASPRSHDRDYDRCIQVWLERGSPPPPGAWNMGGGREVILHELDGTENYSPGAPRVCGFLPGAMRKAIHRQHDSLGLSKPAGFVSFCLPVVFNKRDIGVLPGEGDCSTPSPHRGASECVGGQGLEVFTDLNGVVFGQTIFSVGLQRTWPRSRSGSLCYQRECTAAFFCLPMPRPFGSCPGRFFSGLEQLERHIPVPSNSLSGQGSSEVVVLQRSRDSDSSPLAVSGLVPSSSPEMSEGVPTSLRPFSTPVDIQRPGVLPAVSVLEASRLDVVRNSLNRQGYSDDSIRYILNRLKDSTDNRYQYVWTKFLEFLNANNIYHSDVSAKDVVNFLSSCKHL